MKDNKKWCVIDDCTSKRAVEHLTVCESKEQALAEAEKQWGRLTYHDKKERDRFLVALCNVEKSSDGEWSYMELDNGDIDSNTYEVAREYGLSESDF